MLNTMKITKIVSNRAWIITLFLAAFSTDAYTQQNYLSQVSQDKGKKIEPSEMMYKLIEGMETECHRLYWFNDKLPRYYKNARDFHHKRVNLVLDYSEFTLIAIMNHEKGRYCHLIIVDRNYSIVEEYIYFSAKDKSKYKDIKRRILEGNLRTKAEFDNDFQN